MKQEEPILVAIHCLVYNHEPYLRDCFEGFVMQKTNFRFVAIVHEDCSTDHSADIIREYEAKYPDIFRPIYETENQWSKHDGSLEHIMNEAIDATGAKYVAMCEGDDYWTDPYKLQKQVDFLESHPECSVTFHRCKHYSAYTKEWSSDGLEYMCPTDEPAEISIPHFFKHWCTQPLTMMYRNDAYDPNTRNKYKHFWDTYFIYHLLCAGKGYLLPFVAGVHMVHAGGMSGGLTTEVQRCEFEMISANELYDVNREDPNVKKYWQDTVFWAWNVYVSDGEHQKLYGLIKKEWGLFPWPMTNIIWIQIKRQIKAIFARIVKNE